MLRSLDVPRLGGRVRLGRRRSPRPRSGSRVSGRRAQGQGAQQEAGAAAGVYVYNLPATLSQARKRVGSGVALKVVHVDGA